MATLTADWHVTDSDDNAESVASKAGITGQRHVVTHVSASFSAAVIKLLEIKDGTTVILARYVHSAADLSFPQGLRGSSGNLVSATLAASGAGGTIGKVSIHGYTE